MAATDQQAGTGAIPLYCHQGRGVANAHRVSRGAHHDPSWGPAPHEQAYLNFPHVHRFGAQNHRRAGRTNQVLQEALESFTDHIHLGRLLLPKEEEVTESFQSHACK